LILLGIKSLSYLITLGPISFSYNFIFRKEVDNRFALRFNICQEGGLHTAERQIGNGGGDADIDTNHPAFCFELELAGVITVLSVNRCSVAIFKVVNDLYCFVERTSLEDHYNRADTRDLLSKIQYVDIKTYLVDDILTKVDRASMANSLEVRVPFLDHILMEAIARIPSNLKLQGKQGKYLLKELARDLLPAEILQRKKMGFSMPLMYWFCNELRPVFEEEVLSSNSYSAEYFDLKQVRKKWHHHQRGLRDLSTELWMYLMFEKWARTHLR